MGGVRQIDKLNLNLSDCLDLEPILLRLNETLAEAEIKLSDFDETGNDVLADDYSVQLWSQDDCLLSIRLRDLLSEVASSTWSEPKSMIEMKEVSEVAGKLLAVANFAMGLAKELHERLDQASAGHTKARR